MKQHPNYPTLFITKNGEVYSTKTNKFLKTHTHPAGYKVFTTKFNGKNSPCVLLRVHRLVAETYHDNPNNKPHVNHKDGNKLNNHLSNLEWVTPSENARHAYATGLSHARQRDSNPDSKISMFEASRLLAIYIPRHREFGSRALARQAGISHSNLLRAFKQVEARSAVESQQFT